MVMFRDFTCRKSRKLGIVGFVHNLKDGTVEILAQGSEEKLERLIEYLHKGSLLSNVKNVDIEWHEPRRVFDSFDIVY